MAPNTLGSAQLLLDAAKREDAQQLTAQLADGADQKPWPEDCTGAKLTQVGNGRTRIAY